MSAAEKQWSHQRYHRKRKVTSETTQPESRGPRPGVGYATNLGQCEVNKIGALKGLSYYGIGAVPVQPHYVPVERSPAELLKIIQDIDPKSVLSRQIQSNLPPSVVEDPY